MKQPRQFRYTLDEVDRIRAAVEFLTPSSAPAVYYMGSPSFNNDLASQAAISASRANHKTQVEETVRTYLVAGIRPAVLEKKVEETKSRLKPGKRWLIGSKVHTITESSQGHILTKDELGKDYYYYDLTSFFTHNQFLDWGD